MDASNTGCARKPWARRRRAQRFGARWDSGRSSASPHRARRAARYLVANREFDLLEGLQIGVPALCEGTPQRTHEVGAAEWFAGWAVQHGFQARRSHGRGITCGEEIHIEVGIDARELRVAAREPRVACGSRPVPSPTACLTGLGKKGAERNTIGAKAFACGADSVALGPRSRQGSRGGRRRHRQWRWPWRYRCRRFPRWSSRPRPR